MKQDDTGRHTFNRKHKQLTAARQFSFRHRSEMKVRLAVLRWRFYLRGK